MMDQKRLREDRKFCDTYTVLVSRKELLGWNLSYSFCNSVEHLPLPYRAHNVSELASKKIKSQLEKFQNKNKHYAL